MSVDSVNFTPLHPPRSLAKGEVVLSSEPWVWSFQYNYHKILCAYCFADSANLKTCSNCSLYRYCDTKCQAASWKKEHKHECAMLKQISEKLSKIRDQFDHDCSLISCHKYGCCTAEILMAKVINKIMFQRGDKEEVVGFSGKMSAMEVLELLPQDPQNTNALHFSNVDVCNLIWPAAAVASIPNFAQLASKIYYNAFVIMDQRGKFRLNGMGIFPRALFREMTPVCWDTNVTMDMRERTLVVRTTKDIPQYTGLKDLRENEALPTIYCITLKERRENFQRFYRRPCTCGKCTDEYDAELNPLKCSTAGCSARIPSDKRALQPCPQCGAINTAQLLEYQKLMAASLAMNSSNPDEGLDNTQRLTVVVKLLENVLHEDAHFKFICGFDIADFLQVTMRYEEAWRLCHVEQMVVCIRSIYPDHHLGRARCLVKLGAIPYVWARSVSGQEKKRLQSLFDEALPKAAEWLLEAQNIYKTLGGENSMWAHQVTKFLTRYGPHRADDLEGTGYTGKRSKWTWNNWEAVFRW